jgi:hypothetical protein
MIDRIKSKINTKNLDELYQLHNTLILKEIFEKIKPKLSLLYVLTKKRLHHDLLKKIIHKIFYSSLYSSNSKKNYTTHPIYNSGKKISIKFIFKNTKSDDPNLVNLRICLE